MLTLGCLADRQRQELSVRLEDYLHRMFRFGDKTEAEGSLFQRQTVTNHIPDRHSAISNQIHSDLDVQGTCSIRRKHSDPVSPDICDSQGKLERRRGRSKEKNCASAIYAIQGLSQS